MKMSRNAWVISDGAGLQVFTNRTAVWEHLKLNTGILNDPEVQFDGIEAKDLHTEKGMKKFRAAFIKAIGHRQVSLDKYTVITNWDDETDSMVEESWIDYHMCLITPAPMHTKEYKEKWGY
tara:strand:+ start:417 stop:779 length:363 start_codon:yes stop_codon:yes gene_type:complete